LYSEAPSEQTTLAQFDTRKVELLGFTLQQSRPESVTRVLPSAAVLVREQAHDRHVRGLSRSKDDAGYLSIPYLGLST